MNGSLSSTSIPLSNANADVQFMDNSLKLKIVEEELPKLLTAQLVDDSSRVDVELLMTEFRDELGSSKWEEYRDALAMFFMGKLSRPELVRILRDTVGLKGPSLKNHNTLILSILANCYGDFPPGAESSLTEWRSKNQGKSRYASIDSANNRINREILTLPASERRRIKNLSSESVNMMKQPLFPLPYPSLTQTRQALLPKIPYPEDRNQSNKPQTSQNEPEMRKEDSISSAANAALYDPLLNLHPAHTSSPINWTQNIIQAYDTELASESREIPDYSALGTRMLGLSLEEGVLGGVGVGATDVMMAGLEFYLSGIIEQLVGVTHRKFDGENPLTAEDLNLLFDSRPTEMGELNPCSYKLKFEYLTEDESLPEIKKRGTPLEFPVNQKLKLLCGEEHNEVERVRKDEHEQVRDDNKGKESVEKNAQDNTEQSNQEDQNKEEKEEKNENSVEHHGQDHKQEDDPQQDDIMGEQENKAEAIRIQKEIQEKAIEQHNKGIEVINSLF